MHASHSFCWSGMNKLTNHNYYSFKESKQTGIRRMFFVILQSIGITKNLWKPLKGGIAFTCRYSRGQLISIFQTVTVAELGITQQKRKYEVYPKIGVNRSLHCAYHFLVCIIHCQCVLHTISHSVHYMLLIQCALHAPYTVCIPYCMVCYTFPHPIYYMVCSTISQPNM